MKKMNNDLTVGSRTELRSVLKNFFDSKKTEFFSVHFIKRTDGSLREMNQAQFHVKAHLKGGEPAYDFLAKNLLVVFDHQKGEYRSINMNQVVRIKISGHTYELTQAEIEAMKNELAVK